MKKMLVVSLLSVFVTAALAAIPSWHFSPAKDSQHSIRAGVVTADGGGMPPLCDKKVCTGLNVADGGGMPPLCDKKVCTGLAVHEPRNSGGAV